MDRPEVVLLNQSIDNSTINHITHQLSYDIEQLNLGREVKIGETVVISIGNLELSTILDLVATLVGLLREMGLHPVIFPSEAVRNKSGTKPAIESHNYRSLEVLLGCPIHGPTGVDYIGATLCGLPLYLENLISISDHIIIVNIITPDTSVANFLMPSLQYMMLPGNCQIERISSDRDMDEDLFSTELVKRIIPEIIKRWPILFGVGIVEDKNGHIDHVAVGRMKDPYSGDILDGSRVNYNGPIIWGRGASDMKGGIAAMVIAGGIIKSSGSQLQGDVWVLANALEEPARGEGILHVLEKNSLRAEMSRFLEKFQSEYSITEHPVFGKLPFAVIQISSPVTGLLTVPEQCEIVLNRRFTPEENRDTVQSTIEALVDTIRAEDSEYDTVVEYLGEFPAFYCDPQETIVDLLKNATKNVMGKKTDIGTWTFGTEAGFLMNFGIPSIGFGPGKPSVAHTDNEFVPIDHLVTASKVYVELISLLNNSTNNF